MRKTHQSEGLIAHRPLTNQPVRWFRPRILLYMVILAALMGGFVTALYGHRTLSVTILRALDAPYFEQVNSTGQAVIVNSYRLHAHNQTGASLKITVVLESAPVERVILRVPEPMLFLNAEQSRMIPFTVEIPKQHLQGRESVPLKIRVQEQTYEVEFVAPRI